MSRGLHERDAAAAAADPVPAPKRPAHRSGVAEGVGLILLLHIVVQGVAVIPTQAVSFFAIGLTQLVYVVPVIVWCVMTKRREVLTGVVIAASLTLLLNGACYIVV